MNRVRKIAPVVAFALLTCVKAPAAWADQPFLFGAYTGEKLAQFETMIGHTISIDDHFQTFSELPKSGVAQDIEEGLVPLISWTSNKAHGGDGGSVSAEDILNGVYDSQLDGQADAIAALGGTVLVEWEPEMTDNPRNPLFMAGVAPDQWGPTYVAVWIHIHDIFVGRGATNVQWVWSPGGTAFESHWHVGIPCQPYFPGPAYVDWMGLHSFNKSRKPEAYDANPEFLAFYALAPSWAPGKPLMHAQTGATHETDAQSEWISTAQADLKSEFPLVRGFVWFNADVGGSRAYALSGKGLAAFSAMADDPYFQ
jgi:hypothetical protein